MNYTHLKSIHQQRIFRFIIHVSPFTKKILFSQTKLSLFFFTEILLCTVFERIRIFSLYSFEKLLKIILEAQNYKIHHEHCDVLHKIILITCYKLSLDYDENTSYTLQLVAVYLPPIGA